MFKLEMGRRALIRRLIGIFAIAFGRFCQLKAIDSRRVNRLVFVCRGNVCRSPYAEAAARSLGIPAISCGVDVKYSAPAESNAIQAALLRGKSLSSHMSRSIYDIHLSATDILVAMDPSQLSVCREVASRQGCQITLIGLWRKNPVAEISDPYGKQLKTFGICFDEIDEAMEKLVAKIRSNISCD